MSRSPAKEIRKVIREEEITPSKLLDTGRETDKDGCHTVGGGERDATSHRGVASTWRGNRGRTGMAGMLRSAG